MSESNTPPTTGTPPASQSLPNDSRSASLLAKAFEQLEKAVEKIVILRVTTVMGTVTTKGAGDPMSDTEVTVDPAGQLVAYTAINTALGDANVVISKGFLEDEALNKLHTQALADARAIRKESIDMLRSAIHSILGTPGT